MLNKTFAGGFGRKSFQVNTGRRFANERHYSHFVCSLDSCIVGRFKRISKNKIFSKCFLWSTKTNFVNLNFLISDLFEFVKNVNICINKTNVDFVPKIFKKETL